MTHLKLAFQLSNKAQTSLALFVLNVFFLLSLSACSVHQKSFEQLFGFALPANVDFVAINDPAQADSPRFETIISQQQFEQIQVLLMALGHSDWKRIKYKPSAGLTLRQLVMYGYEEGNAEFSHMEYVKNKAMRRFFYSHQTGEFIAIYQPL